MLRIKFYLAAAGISLLIFVDPSFSRADDPSLQNPDERISAVNQELDMFEDSHLKSGEAQKEFDDTAQPDRQGAGRMLKRVLTTGISENCPTKPPSNVRTRINTFDIGSEIFYYRYTEPSTIVQLVSGGNSGVVHPKRVGPMFGYYANYTYRPPAPNFLNNFLTDVYILQARYAVSHDLDFSGEGNVKDKHDDEMEFRGLVGKDYQVGRDTLVTPYLGFGYRYLLDRGNGQISSLGYFMNDQRSHYYYLPLGGNVAVNLPRDWEMDLNAEYDILLLGMQKDYYSDWDQFSGGQKFPDVSYHQSHGFGVRASVKFIKHGPVVDFYIEPYFRFWNIDSSETITWYNGAQVGQPNYNTAEIGSKFGIQF